MAKASKAGLRARGKAKLRLGIYDGTFRPIHFGHLFCGEWGCDELALHYMLYVTSGRPPNKEGVVAAAEVAAEANTRHELTAATVADNPRFIASRVALEHNGDGFSLLAVEAISKQYPGAELFYFTSSEYLVPDYKWFIGKWVGGKELCKLCTIVVFPRGDHTRAQIEEWTKLVPGARFYIADLPSPDLSSTYIRELVEAGKSIRYTTPLVTQQLVYKQGLYRGPNTPPLVAEVPLCDQQLKRVCLYGRQFNPIHYGDLWRAEWTRQHYDHDRVNFITSAAPPSNKGVVLSAELRHEMAVIATADNPHFDTSRVDIDRHTTSYTLLTVKDMRRKYGDGVELDWLLSSKYLDPALFDAASDDYLPNWMGASELFGLCRFLIYPEDHKQKEVGQAWVDKIRAAHPLARVEFMKDAPIPAVSDQMIRDRVKAGKSVWYTLPWAVQLTMQKHGLYLD